MCFDRIKPGALTFAGTKDRRGLTSQLMCLKWGEPRRLFYLSKRLQNTFLGNYSFKEKPLRLGDLKGNQFKIALRFVGVVLSLFHVPMKLLLYCKHLIKFFSILFKEMPLVQMFR